MRRFLFLALAVLLTCCTAQQATLDHISGEADPIVCALNPQHGIPLCAHLAFEKRCLNEKHFRAGDAPAPNTITFENLSDTMLNVFWIDGHGERELYHTLAPREAVRQRTYAGHFWLLATPQNNCVGIYGAPTESVVIH